MTNREKLILLAWSRYDRFPFPHGALRSASGLAPAAKVTCPDCDGGWRTDRFKQKTPCSTCGGTDVKAGRGWVKVDPMDTERQAIRTELADAATRPTKAPRVVKCDSCSGMGAHGNGRRCEHCDGTGKRTSVRFELAVRWGQDGGDPWLGWQDTGGSYAEFEQAIGELPYRWRRLIINVHGPNANGRVDHLTPGETATLELAFAQLEALMPLPILVPRAVRDAWKRKQERKTLAARTAGPNAQAKRDKEIRRFARQQKPTQWIAAEYGLSVRRVNEIIDEEAAA